MSWSRTSRRPPKPSVPEWSNERTGTRVLLEVPDPLVRDSLERDLAARGYQVLACGGPSLEPDEGVTCPVLRQERCPAVSGADVVVSTMSLTRPITRLIQRRVARYGHPPLILAAPEHVVDTHGDGMTPYQVFPVAPEAVARMVEAVT